MLHLVSIYKNTQVLHWYITGMVEHLDFGGLSGATSGGDGGGERWKTRWREREQGEGKGGMLRKRSND